MNWLAVVVAAAMLAFVLGRMYGVRLARIAHPTVDRELTAMLLQARRLREILNNMQRMTRDHVATSARPH
jgi:uncharacterized membrane-anchored protein YhcB (DUF1043 family)